MEEFSVSSFIFFIVLVLVGYYAVQKKDVIKDKLKALVSKAKNKVSDKL